MITLGVPTHNRAAVLAETLNALGKLEMPEEGAELIVVDNRSTDHTAEVCRHHMPSYGRYVREERIGVSSARNRVFEEAQGDLVVLTDDDTNPVSDWLVQYAGASRTYPDAAFFMGPTEWLWRTDPPAWYCEDPKHRMIFCYRTDLGDTDMPIPPEIQPAGPNMAVRKAVYDRLGGFRPELGVVGKQKFGAEEGELIMRYRQAGLDGWYIAAARVQHRVYDYLLSFGYMWNGMVGAGHGESIMANRFDDSAHWDGMPLWWYRLLLTDPPKNLLHLVGHTLRGQWTAVVHHALRLGHWTGRLRFLLNRRKYRHLLREDRP